MLTKRQLQILGAFTRNIFGEFTYTQLKNAVKDKSNSTMQNAIAAFKEESLITERKIGSANLYRLNHEGDRLYDYLALIFKSKIPKELQRPLEMVKTELNKHNPFYALIIFGSYADETATRDSDLDLAIIIRSKAEKNPAEISMKTVLNRSLVEIDYHIITQKEFITMLKADYENLGKEIVRKHLAVHNPSIFYHLCLQQKDYFWNELRMS